MVSIGPYTQSTDMKHMYNFTDLNCNITQDVYEKNTLMDVISKNSDMSIFTNIIKKAQYTEYLCNKDVNYTLFVPSDVEITQKYSKEFINNIDKGLAIQIVKASLMNRVLDKSIIQSSPSHTLPTFDRSNSIYINTISDKTYIGFDRINENHDIYIINWDQPASNGIIHITNNILIPTSLC